jgi:hypothetical protein
MFRLKRRIRRFLMQRIKKIFQQHGMSLCAHFLRSQLDGVGAVSGAVEHEWSQQTRTAKLTFLTLLSNDFLIASFTWGRLNQEPSTG